MLAAAESWGVPVLLAGKGVGDAEVETWESVAAAGTDDVGEGCDDGAECRLWDTLALRAAKEGGCARCWVSATRSATQASTFCNWRPSARVRKLLMMSTRSPFLIDALSAETTLTKAYSHAGGGRRGMTARAQITLVSPWLPKPGSLWKVACRNSSVQALSGVKPILASAHTMLLSSWGLKEDSRRSVAEKNSAITGAGGLAPRRARAHNVLATSCGANSAPTCSTRRKNTDRKEGGGATRIVARAQQVMDKSSEVKRSKLA
mmetsp:Transcript_13556/g.36683  ORF Transcript_13556/g.36683 Transcript_13556/m.36683 type:complete len:262 (+) Transcript_13556:770-1555(+)